MVFEREQRTTMHLRKITFSNGTRTGVSRSFSEIGQLQTKGNGEKDRGIPFFFFFFAHLWGSFLGTVLSCEILFVLFQALWREHGFCVHSLSFFFSVIELLRESSYC